MAGRHHDGRLHRRRTSKRVRRGKRKRRGGIFDRHARFEPSFHFVETIGPQTRHHRIFYRRNVEKRARVDLFFAHAFVSFVRGEEYRPQDLWTRFPAHLHINVADGQRGGGIGRQLADSFFEHMRENGILTAHVRTATREPHQHFFESCGFKILVSRRFTLWSYLGEPTLYLITYGLDLKP